MRFLDLCHLNGIWRSRYNPMLSAYALKRDLINKIKYGSGGPKFAEKIVINVSDVVSIWDGSKNKGGGYFDSAQVRVSFSVKPLSTAFLIARLEDHWDRGASWESIGEWERFSEILRIKKPFWITPDGFLQPRTKQSILDYFMRCDKLFFDMQDSKRLEPISDVAFRSWGGVLIHIGPEGVPIFGGGNHRFAAARVLGLQKIPAQIGVVQQGAIKYLDTLRNI